MAGQTFTATTLMDQPRVIADGINIMTAKYVATTTTLSVSDIIAMIRVPEGATIIDGYVSGKSSNTTNLAQVIKCGFGFAAATDDDLLSSGTISGTTALLRFNGAAGLPYQTPTIAAGTYPKYNWLTVTCVSSSSTTASVSLQVSIVYLTGNLSGLA